MRSMDQCVTLSPFLIFLGMLSVRLCECPGRGLLLLSWSLKVPSSLNLLTTFQTVFLCTSKVATTSFRCSAPFVALDDVRAHPFFIRALILFFVVLFTLDHKRREMFSLRAAKGPFIQILEIGQKQGSYEHLKSCTRTYMLLRRYDLSFLLSSKYGNRALSGFASSMHIPNKFLKTWGTEEDLVNLNGHCQGGEVTMYLRTASVPMNQQHQMKKPMKMQMLRVLESLKPQLLMSQRLQQMLLLHLVPVKGLKILPMFEPEGGLRATKKQAKTAWEEEQEDEVLVNWTVWWNHLDVR